MKKVLLEVKNLRIQFRVKGSVVTAVENVNFKIYEGEVLGVVGESGCGKSVTAMSIMRLLDSNVAIVTGEVLFNGENLLNVSNGRMREIRGKEISMIFQEPMTSLNPLHKIGDQIMEVYKIHNKMSKQEASKKSLEMLELVGIPMAEKVMNYYPHNLSGGMRQRVMIAIALAGEPKLIVADEPTTALDVTIQAQILALLRDLNKKLKTSIMMITHDMGVVAQMSDRVNVMYAGQIIETGDVIDLFDNHRHPYTGALLNSIPTLTGDKNVKLSTIPGMVPALSNMPLGCNFEPRCSVKCKTGLETKPNLEEINEGHYVRCHQAIDVRRGQ